MAYQTIMANLSHDHHASAVLGVADKLAERHAAHLLGLHVKSPLDIPLSAEIPMPIEMTRLFAERQLHIESNIKALFEKLTATVNYVAEWRSVDALFDSVADTIVEQGNTADLLILMNEEGGSEATPFKGVLQQVLLAIGRPVMIVPPQLMADTIGERIMVSWDGRQESTRALFGALPLLRRAAEVRLHRFNLPHQDRHRIVGITEELANTLSRHGVRLEVMHSDAKQGEIADELLACSRDMDADTLVMGCYGHNSFRDFLFGSTTREVLRNTTVPLIMCN